jgi:hypothetical protein
MHTTISNNNNYINIKSPLKITRIDEDEYGYRITIPKNIKVCNRCKEVKHIDEFGLDSNRKDKKRIYCIECQALFNKEYKKTEAGVESSKQSSKKWKRQNKDKVSEYNHKYYKRKLLRKDVILKKNEKLYNDKILKSIYDKFGNTFCYACEAPTGQSWIEFINRRCSMVYVKERKIWIPVCKKCKTKLM